MRKKLYSLMMLIALLMFTACDEYVSSYSAVGMVTACHDDTCGLDFYSFEGRRVMKPRFTLGDEGEIEYTASLEVGEINVYYVFEEEMLLLFNLKAGEEINGRGGHIEGKKQIIVVETVEKSRGSLSLQFVACE